jgi:hypothetical protein
MVKSSPNQSQRKKKDPNAPKRAMSAFFCFQMGRRDSLKKERPGLSITELVSEMSKEWNSFGESDKIIFNKMAEEEKIRYEREKKAYIKQ